MSVILEWFTTDIFFTNIAVHFAFHSFMVLSLSKLFRYNMHYFLRTLLFLLLFIFIADTMDAQRRRTSSRRDRYEPQESFEDKLGYSISFGNFSFGSGFFISSKLQGIYKVQDFLSVGLHGELYYNFVNVFNGDDFSLFDAGVGPLARVHVAEGFYLQGEYSYTSLDFPPNSTLSRESYLYPLIGGGYTSGGGGRWSYGLHVLFIANEEVRDVKGESVEYWIDFHYRF